MRVVTRPDFDGVVCAALLMDALRIDTSILWTQPSDMQHRRVDIREGDVVANLPLSRKLLPVVRSPLFQPTGEAGKWGL